MAPLPSLRNIVSNQFTQRASSWYCVHRVVYASAPLILLASYPGSAQPFGVAEGTSPGDLKIERTVGPFAEYIKPKISHPNIQSYMAIASPKTGVCKLVGLSPTLANDQYGSEARYLFDGLSGQISTDFGNSKLDDVVSSGFVMTDQRDWALSVYQNNRVYSKLWDVKDHSIQHGGVSEVLLQIRALDADTTYVSVSFEYDNFDRCSAEIDAGQH